MPSLHHLSFEKNVFHLFYITTKRWIKKKNYKRSHVNTEEQVVPRREKRYLGIFERIIMVRKKVIFLYFTVMLLHTSFK